MKGGFPAKIDKSLFFPSVGAANFCIQDKSTSCTTALCNYFLDFRSMKFHLRTGSVVGAMPGCLAMDVENQLWNRHIKVVARDC